ncbi:hypothetical protein QUA46_15095 [Microcoleus sp. MON2_D6]|uniref:hypothetical protein n=1 Tax=unclassified Microcoleus TaxID=2642155 RepID=UPI002FD32FED
MSDEQKIVIANTGSGVINVIITGPNPIVISDPNITEPGEVLPPGDNVDNSIIITPNNEIDITAPAEVLPPGDNVDNSTIISPNNKDVNEKKQVNLSNSPSPIESLVVTLLTLGVILIVLICFWPYILGGGLLLLIVTVVLRFVWVWLTDRFSKKF